MIKIITFFILRGGCTFLGQNSEFFKTHFITQNEARMIQLQFATNRIKTGSLYIYIYIYI